MILTTALFSGSCRTYADKLGPKVVQSLLDLLCSQLKNLLSQAGVRLLSSGRDQEDTKQDDGADEDKKDLRGTLRVYNYHLNNYVGTSHPHLQNRLSGVGLWGQQLFRPQTSLSCATLNSCDRGVPRCSQDRAKSIHLVLGLLQGLRPTGRVWNTSLQRHPVGILNRTRTTSTNSFLRRGAAALLSSSRKAELLTLSLRETPATLLRKPITHPS